VSVEDRFDDISSEQRRPHDAAQLAPVDLFSELIEA
jgi:hypothetical protein